jgi:aminopeptidase N
MSMLGILLLMLPLTYQQPVEGVARELAKERSAVISDVRYDLRLDLAPGAERLKGQEEIRFRLSREVGQIAIDFRDLDASGKVINGSIGGLTVNGKAADSQLANGHIVIDGKGLAAGDNVISMGFESGIAPANRPVTRYLDHDDGREYLYTLFVPMDASLAFPCFDQPDLKGRFKLELAVPESSDWTAVSNSSLLSSRSDGGHRRFTFAETRPISTYLFAFAVGPFHELVEPGGTMRLYVRQSKVKQAQAEAPEIFRITRQGITHLSEFFDFPFPFPKYDFVLIPGFAYGGMEHAGSTFFREESLLFRSLPTTGDKLGRASLLLHELAHQWFGDLVTMRWFDDLWLKEGFANFMAFESMTSLYPPRDIWKRFYQSHKPAAYAIDSTKGTTPIYQEVRNLKDAKSAYGAIVYSKAPGILKALRFLLGEEQFRTGVRLFLKEHQYANAEWSDLINALERASGQKLTGWADAWVRHRGMPRIDIQWSCDNSGRISSLVVEQRDILGEGGVWPVRSSLLLARDSGPSEHIDLRLDTGRTEITAARGKQCPAFIFANDEDYGYGQFSLDARSRPQVAARIGHISDPFLRTILWGSLWESVRDAEMAPLEYISLALESLTSESDEELTLSLTTRVTGAFQRYLSADQQTSVAGKIEELFWNRIMKAPELGQRIVYFRAFRGVATTPLSRSRLKELIDGRAVVKGLELKPLDRWRILTSLMALGDPDAATLVAAERKRDSGDEARKYAYVAEAARPDRSSKQRYFDDYLSKRDVPEDWVEGSLGAFNSWNQASLTLAFLKPALAAIPQVKRERKIFFLLAWLNAFIGGQQGKEALAIVQQYLGEEGLDRDVVLKVLEVSDELERTVRIRSRF